MIFGLTGNFRKDRFYEIVNLLYPIINKNGHSCLISSDYMSEDKVNSIDKNIDALDFSHLVEKAEVIITIGGDGTLLSTARRMEKNIKPILGIHIGGLGFLAESTCKNMEIAIEDISNGD